ncbi:hypothetical protein ACN1T9_001318 [Cronobacter sakazakii]|uniref:hypothetical protein n=1 Tax=Cronobacter sakazakii TaxID=28141 RepID=UPI000A18BE3B|nr:hypothetical protein [Cronobacter sakazakii]EMA4137034.1 hypothetical protein [Cronobacter turicensis]EKK4066497.1 hypothetical protein [Cronobacter sakazakii]ELQ6111958.1 hypothetical protein [Cronobacter sakazakii]ELQ6146176.1 hypothetical protein [Cronobacter sakazakii]ELY6088305.1 hypothetical protein [Cronobacter sakazakii]
MSRLKKEPLVRVSEEGGIEIRKIQYPDNTVERIYKQKGVILPRIPLKGRFVEQYVALQLLDKDLRNVIGWEGIIKNICDNLNQEQHFTHPDLEKNLMLKSLFISKVITYGKCFTEAKGRRFTLQRSNVPEQYRDLHDLIMNIRHNFAAHKGEFEYDQCGLALTLPGTKKKRYYHIFVELHQINYGTDEEDNERFLKLYNSLRVFIKEKQEKLIAKIYAEKIHTQSMTYWLSRTGKETEI